MSRQLLVVTLFLLAVTQASLRGQSITAGLSGVVEDPQGLVIHGASVTVTNQGTNASVQLQTDQTGRFRALTLAPGDYSVTVVAAGFAKFTLESVRLGAGEVRNVTLPLQPGTLNQEITVTGENVSQVGLDVGGQGKTYGLEAMRDLPMFIGFGGRNFRTQVYLTPGMTPSPVAHRPFISSGARTRNNNYLVDSNDYNEIEGGLTLGRGLSEQTLPSESIEGVQVLTHNFKAEYGRQNGSIISLVSKHGTNDWHGLGYEFFRHDALGTRNTFDVTKPPYKLNQFGANAGGPLKRDRTFIFGNIEWLEQRTAAARSIQTLTAEQKATAAPAVQPLVSMFPEPNSPGGLFRAGIGSKGSTDTFLVRVDHTLTERQRLFTRYRLAGPFPAPYLGAIGLDGERRAESFNLTNSVNYDLPDGLLTSRNFGQAIAAFDSRQTQLALRLSF